MRFAQVEGVVRLEQIVPPLLRLTVFLDTGTRLDVVRDEVVAPLRALVSDDDLIWHADQWTQETIGVDLAEQGWEVIGAGEVPAPEPGALARSASYAVRHLG